MIESIQDFDRIKRLTESLR